MHDFGIFPKFFRLSLRSVTYLGTLAALTLLMSACATVGPEFTTPEVPVSDRWREGLEMEARSEFQDYRDWWSVFRDPALDQLVSLACRENLSLQVAGVRILEARAQLGYLTGNQYPQLQQMIASGSRTHLSENQANTYQNRHTEFNELQIGFDAAWELDLWGKYRRSVQAGLADFQASVASYDDILVVLTAEVARTYILLRSLEEQLKIARENVAIQKRSLRIAEVRYQGGDVFELDVTQARSLLRTTEAVIPRLTASIRQAKNALAVLAGKLPGELDALIEGEDSLPAIPGQMALDVPANLLRRRPDIRLAEMQVAAQFPRIGVAKADLYPHFTLSGSIGLNSSSSVPTKAGGLRGSDLIDVLNRDSLQLFAGPSLKWDILNYGRIKNRVRVEDARLQQLILTYRNTVLSAHQEVEDSLSVFLKSQEEERLLADAVVASSRSVNLSMLQYREGLIDYQRVLDAQRNLAQQQNAWIQSRSAVATSLVSLYKALGGGWQIREEIGFMQESVLKEMSGRTDWGRLIKEDLPGATPNGVDHPDEQKDPSR